MQMTALPPLLRRLSSPTLVWMGVAFVYWTGVMAALTPGNLQGVAQPQWGWEALRLIICGLLGASVTPVLLVLARRRPGLTVQAAALVGNAVVLIVLSCFLVAWLKQGRLAPTVADVRQELGANLLLLVVCQALLLVLIRVTARPTPVPDWNGIVTIADRGRVTRVDLAAVAWIESQGNYQALHVGGAVHLLRETSTALETRLDPSRFVRIHRGIIVAIERVREVRPLTNGDALVCLDDGRTLRMSRKFRAAARARLGA